MKKSILMFSLLTVLIVGGFFGYIETKTNSNLTVIRTESLRAIGGIPEYTKMATSIVVGEVVKISNLSERTGITYPRNFFDAEIQVSEVLKGDLNATKVIVTGLGVNENVQTEDSVSFKVGEKVLVMLAMDAEGNNVVFAGSAGKFVIDENNNVKDETGATMSLGNLKMQILEAMNGVTT